MPSRSSLASAALFAVALAVSLLGAEGVLRLQNSSMKNYNIEMWRYARELKTPSAITELGHEHLRNRSATLQSVEVRLNEKGLRGGPLQPLPPRGRRILFLGGSITLGWGVQEDQTVTARLQQMFHADGQEVQVLNAGVGNYNTLRYTENFFCNLTDLQPTDIVIEFFLRDAEQLEPGGGNILLRNSELAVTIWAALQNFLAPHGENALVDHYDAAYDPAAPGFLAMKVQLGKLADYTRENNIRIYFAIMPDVHNLSDYPFKKLHQQMKDVALELNYTFVDLLPGFLDLKPEEIWAMPGDPHPNALGHKIMADQIYPILRINP